MVSKQKLEKNQEKVQCIKFIKKGFFGAEKPGDKKMVEAKKEISTENQGVKNFERKQQIKQLLEEFGSMFDDVVTEIEERQNHMMEMTAYGETEMAEKAKNEIVERVSELQKITKLMNEEKTKLNALD